jgi:phage N-6-adenine-methyltransferase
MGKVCLGVAMPTNSGMMSSNNEEYETPQWLFDYFDEIYKFDLDAAASSENAKVIRYYTKEDNALALPWDGVVWCNPPYGRKVGKFVKKAIDEVSSNPKTETIVLLLASRTDTRWFREAALAAQRLIFVSGRLRFEGGEHPAPFPSVVIVLSKEESEAPLVPEFLCHYKEMVSE